MKPDLAMHNWRKNSFFFLSGLLIITLGAYGLFGVLGRVLAAPADPLTIVLRGDQEVYLLGTYVDYLEDPGGALTFEQISSAQYAAQFKPGTSDVLNFGLSNSVYWLRLRVRNDAPADRLWRLELVRSTINTIVLYRPASDGAGYTGTKTGYIYPFSTREVPHVNFIFELSIPPGSEQVLYMSVKDKSMQLPLTIWDKSAMQQRDLTVNLLYGLAFGALLIMLVYNLFMTLILREQSFVYYTLYLVFAILFLANYHAIAQHYLWPDATDLNTFIIPLTICLTLTTFFLFVGAFFQLPRLARGWTILYRGLLLLVIACTLASPFFKVAVLDVVIPLGGLMLCYTLAAAVWTWLHGYKPARFFMLSWTFFVGIVLANIGESLGLININMSLSDMGMMFGLVFGVAFQSLALADRFNLYKQEMINAQAAMMAQQSESIRLKDELTRRLEESHDELEQKVAERTQRLHDLNQELAGEVERRKEAQQAAELLAQTDPLTGIYNRRYFSQLVDLEFKKALRYHQPLSMLVMDVDFFKQVNDHFGHTTVIWH